MKTQMPQSARTTRIAWLSLALAIASLNTGCGRGDGWIGEQERFYHKNRVLDLAFLPDGKHFVSAEMTGLSDDEDGARLWSIENATIEATITTDACAAVAVSPDRRTIAAGTLGGRVHLWDVQNKRESRSWRIVSGSVIALAFSPDGKQLAVAQGPRWLSTAAKEGLPSYTVWIHSIISGESLDAIGGLSSPCNSVAFVDSSDLALSTWSRSLRLWSLSEAKAIWSIEPAEYRFEGFQYNQSRAALSSSKSLVFWQTGVYRISDGELQTALDFTGRGDNLLAACFIYNDARLLTADTHGEVKIWDVQTGTQLWQQETSKNRADVTALALSPDGKTFLTGTFQPKAGFVAIQKKVPPSDPYVRLWKLPDLPK